MRLEKCVIAGKKRDIALVSERDCGGRAAEDQRAKYGRKHDLDGPCAQPWSGAVKQWCWGSPLANDASSTEMQHVAAFALL